MWCIMNLHVKGKTVAIIERGYNPVFGFMPARGYNPVFGFMSARGGRGPICHSDRHSYKDPTPTRQEIEGLYDRIEPPSLI